MTGGGTEDRDGNLRINSPPEDAPRLQPGTCIQCTDMQRDYLVGMELVEVLCRMLQFMTRNGRDGIVDPRGNLTGFRDDRCSHNPAADQEDDFLVN